MFYGFFCFLAYLRMPSLPLVKDVKEQKATFPYRKLFTPDHCCPKKIFNRLLIC